MAVYADAADVVGFEDNGLSADWSEVEAKVRQSKLMSLEVLEGPARATR